MPTREPLTSLREGERFDDSRIAKDQLLDYIEAFYNDAPTFAPGLSETLRTTSAFTPPVRGGRALWAGRRQDRAHMGALHQGARGVVVYG